MIFAEIECMSVIFSKLRVALAPNASLILNNTTG
jgi:hypothetical protein